MSLQMMILHDYEDIRYRSFKINEMLKEDFNTLQQFSFAYIY
jgi:hypothetical protein